MTDNDDAPGTFASPPCFMHEIDPVYAGLAPAGLSDAETAALGRALAHDLPDAVVLAGPGGAIRHWNAGAERIFGYSAAEAIGASLDIIIPERLRARHWAGYEHMMATGRSRHGPAELLSVPAVTKAGDALSVQFTLAVVRDAAGGITGVVAVLRDVTATFAEMKRLRAAVRT